MAIGIVRVHYDDMTSLPDRERAGETPVNGSPHPFVEVIVGDGEYLYIVLSTLYIRKIGFASTLLLLLADACQPVCRSLFGQYCMPPKVSAATYLDISFSS